MIYINGVALPEQPAEVNEAPNLIYNDQNSVTGYKERITYGARKKVTMGWTYIKPATQQLLMSLFTLGEPVTYLNDDSKLYGGQNEFVGIITPNANAYIRGGTGYMPFSLTIEEGYVYSTVSVASNRGTDFLIANTIASPLKSVQLYGDTVQDGTPSPSTPVPIFNVTGEQFVVITDGGDNVQNLRVLLESKNHFDGLVSTGYIISSTGEDVAVSDGVTTAAIAVAPNTTYTASAIIANDSDKYMRVGIYDAQMTFLSRPSAPNGVLTFTTPANAAFVKLSYFTPASEVMLEQGDAKTSYVPYMKASELCKVGNAQDYIYQSAGAWMLHKAVGKIRLDGSSSVFTSNTTVETGKNRFRATVAGIMPATSVTTAMMAYCDGLVAGSAADTYRCIECIAVDIVNNYIWVYTDETAGYSAEQFNEWLSTKQFAFYYQLATPVDTVITDESLIAQLNALAAATTYNGVTTFSTNGNLPAVLSVEAYVTSGGSQ